MADAQPGDAAQEQPAVDAASSAGDSGSNQLDSGGASDAAADQDGPRQLEGGADAAQELPDGGSDAGPVDAISTEGLVLWLRADLGVNVESGSVSTWTDQSPSHLDPAQPMPSQRPAYRAASASGLPAVVFDGVDDVLVLPAGFDDFTAGLTILAVVRHATTTGDYVPYFECSNGSEMDDVSLGRFRGELHFEIDEQVLNASSAVDAVVHQFSALLRPSQELSLRRDGLTVGARALVPLPRLVQRDKTFVGGSLYADAVKFAGDIHELIVYRRALEVAELVNLENALHARWPAQP